MILFSSALELQDNKKNTMDKLIIDAANEKIFLMLIKDKNIYSVSYENSKINYEKLIILINDFLKNYDLKIICFNTDEGLGNEFMLPAGPLRESINELKKYDIAFLNGEKKNNKLLSKLKSINKNPILRSILINNYNYSSLTEVLNIHSSASAADPRSNIF